MKTVATTPVPRFEILLDPPDDITEKIRHGLRDFNRSVLGSEINDHYTPIAIVSRGESNQIIGGLLGAFTWGAMKIDVLWVSDEQRGKDIGTRLMMEAESAARQRGVTLIFLDTTSFQARAFYERLGYTVYGQLDNFPIGHTFFHLKKILSAPSPLP